MVHMMTARLMSHLKEIKAVWACQAVIALGTHGMAGQEGKCCGSCSSHMTSP